MGDDTSFDIHFIDGSTKESLKQEILKELQEYTDKRMQIWLKEQEEDRAEHGASFERHAQAVECLLDNMNKVLERKL